MNREEAAKLWPVIKAWAEGKRVEFLNYDGKWALLHDNVCFSYGPPRYRIAPEPKLRPWKADEVPVGAVVGKKGLPSAAFLILAVLADRVYVGTGTIQGGGIGLGEMLDKFKLINGDPCGVLEVPSDGD